MVLSFPSAGEGNAKESPIDSLGIHLSNCLVARCRKLFAEKSIWSVMPPSTTTTTSRKCRNCLYSQRPQKRHWRHHTQHHRDRAFLHELCSPGLGCLLVEISVIALPHEQRVSCQASECDASVTRPTGCALGDVCEVHRSLSHSWVDQRLWQLGLRWAVMGQIAESLIKRERIRQQPTLSGLTPDTGNANLLIGLCSGNIPAHPESVLSDQGSALTSESPICME